MRDIFRLFLGGPVLVVLLITTLRNNAMAQPASPNDPGKSVASGQPSQAEIQQSYRGLQEQLRATQVAIVKSRLETEAKARAQAENLAEQINTMNATLAADRRARQEESVRAEVAREIQQAEIQRTNRSIIWIAVAFGSVGLVAMLFTAQFQWRTINRMAQVIDERPLLPYPTEYGPPLGATGAAGSQSPALSAQRLLTAINRIEQRIKELEPAVVRPVPATRQTSVEADV